MRNLLQPERRDASFLLIVGGVIAALSILCGCSPLEVSSPAELALFERGGPIVPKVDVSAIVQAKHDTGPYRVVTGDVLQLTMPEILRIVAKDATGVPQPHVCRVGEEGMITLPLVGDIKAGGKTLNEIEKAAVAAYWPAYVKAKPAVVAEVLKYHTVKVAITGAVKDPGLYELRSDELSLVAALMKAGGIAEGGACAVRIHKPGEKLTKEPLILPVEGLNIPFADVALKGGETVEVLRANPRVVAVLGLVNKPGTFEYPLGATYNLLQAIGLAGGLDINSGPRYVQVYRQGPDGRPLVAVFNVAGEGQKQAAGVMVKPGDVVFVADTMETQVRRVLIHLAKSVFHVGAYYRLGELD